MRIPVFSILTLTLPVCLAAIRAEEPPTTQPSRTVGSVYGEAITAADIGLSVPIDPTVKFDSRDTEQWKQMGRVMIAFGKPVNDRFVKQRKIDATAEEIEAFKRTWRKRRKQHLRETEDRLEKGKTELALPNLPDDKRTKLEENQALLERILPSLRDAANGDVPEAFARKIIVTRKIERELHRTHGGRVIFQQAGPEALDARRLLYEEAEKNGDLKFDDMGVRHLFYYYYSNMSHSVIDENVLEKVWSSEVGN